MTNNSPPIEPKFLADSTVVRLAKWLRILGYDADCSMDLSERSILDKAATEGRTILSRKRKWPVSGLQGPEIAIVERERIRDQLREVMERFEIPPGTAKLLTRCVRCNTVLVEVSKASVTETVPPHIDANVTRFRQCLRCGRIYWQGSHPEKIRQFLRLNSLDRFL